MTKYTDEMVAFIANEYTVRRDAGELNRDILEALIVAVANEFDVEVNAASLRAKLNSTRNEDETFVYRKDTDAEKEILGARKGTPGKVAKVTKRDIALQILKAVGADVELAEDLSRAKADTLKALAEALYTLVANAEADVDVLMGK